MAEQRAKRRAKAPKAAVEDKAAVGTGDAVKMQEVFFAADVQRPSVVGMRVLRDRLIITANRETKIVELAPERGVEVIIREGQRLADPSA